MQYQRTAIERSNSNTLRVPESSSHYKVLQLIAMDTQHEHLRMMSDIHAQAPQHCETCSESLQLTSRIVLYNLWPTANDELSSIISIKRAKHSCTRTTLTSIAKHARQHTFRNTDVAAHKRSTY
jgi:hypothetical protein